MSITLFKTLIAVSETGSFSAAASKVFVTHAAVGQQMKRLEELLGVVLFDRAEKPPRLNHLGKALVPKARNIVREYETILDDLTGDPALIGELVLGAVPSTLPGLLPKSVKKLIEVYPNLHVRVIPALTTKLEEMVNQGTIDAAVLSEPAYIHRNINWLPFVKEELVLLTAEEVSETNIQKILSTMPYIRHSSKAAAGILVEDWLSRQNFIVNDAMEMDSLENLTSMVAHNLGVSVVPNICVPDSVFKRLRKIPLGSDVPSRTLGILTRSDCSKYRLVEQLLDQMKVVVAEH